MEKSPGLFLKNFPKTLTSGKCGQSFFRRRVGGRGEEGGDVANDGSFNVIGTELSRPEIYLGLVDLSRFFL